MPLTSLTIRRRFTDCCPIRNINKEILCDFRPTDRGLHFPLHGVCRILGLFAHPLNVFPETVNRIASRGRA